jgi:hypothetical protein
MGMKPIPVTLSMGGLVSPTARSAECGSAVGGVYDATHVSDLELNKVERF